GGRVYGDSVAAEITVHLVREGGEEARCKTINISSNGIAVNTPTPFQTGEQLHISFVLPGGASQLRARGAVMWDDRHGKTGLTLQCVNPQMQLELDSWLDSNFNRALGRAN